MNLKEYELKKNNFRNNLLVI